MMDANPARTIGDPGNFGAMAAFLEVLYAKDGESELAIDLTKKHSNSWSSMHGGVTMTLLDVCMSRAARSADSEESGAATIEMKVSFFQPGGQIGQRVTAKGRLLHNSGRMFSVEGKSGMAKNWLPRLWALSKSSIAQSHLKAERVSPK